MKLIVHRVAAVARPDNGEAETRVSDLFPVQRAVVGADVDAAQHDDPSLLLGPGIRAMSSYAPEGRLFLIGKRAK